MSLWRVFSSEPIFAKAISLASVSSCTLPCSLRLQNASVSFVNTPQNCLGFGIAAKNLRKNQDLLGLFDLIELGKAFALETSFPLLNLCVLLANLSQKFGLKALLSRIEVRRSMCFLRSLCEEVFQPWLPIHCRVGRGDCHSRARSSLLEQPEPGVP